LNLPLAFGLEPLALKNIMPRPLKLLNTYQRNIFINQDFHGLSILIGETCSSANDAA